MDNAVKKYLFLVSAFVIFLVALLLENNFLSHKPDEQLLKKFQADVIEKETQLTADLVKITLIITDENFNDDYLGKLYSLSRQMEVDNLGFLILQDKEIKYWSSRIFAFNEIAVVDSCKTEMVKLPNGYYILKQDTVNNLRIIGLIPLKYNYPHENEHLKNTFQSNFNLPKDYIISEKQGEGYFPVYGSDGEFIFSILPAGEVLCTKTQLYYPVILYMISLLLILIYARFEFKSSNRQVGFKLFVLGGGLFFVYWLHVLFQSPEVFYVIGFFSPEHFAYSIWLPSLGDYFLTSLFFCFWALNFNYDIDFKQLIKKSFLPKRFFAFLIFFALGGLYLTVHSFIVILIENSSFSFSLNRIVGLSAQSVIAYFSIAILLTGLALITFRIIEDIKPELPLKTNIFILLLVAVLLAVLQLIIVSEISIPVLILFFVFISTLFIFLKEQKRHFTLSFLIILVSFFSIYSLFVVYLSVSEKERGFQRSFAFNLVTETDPVAELILTNIQNRINVDPEIPNLLIQQFEENDPDPLANYLINNFFGGYLEEEYDIWIGACSDSTIIEVQPDNIRVPCFPFFEEKIKIEGLQVPGTKFYFMDNMNGLITYFGELNYPFTEDSMGVSIFIELNSKIISEGIGYPELLMDESMKKPENYRLFQYAKYNNGQLGDVHGNLMYNKYISLDDSLGEEEFVYKKWDRYEHIIYRTSGDNYVIVSRSIYGVIEYLISFPYIFVFYLLLTLIFLFFGSSYVRQKSITFDFKFKVQAAIISVVLLSLLIVAIGTIFYNIENYKEKHRDDLSEKMQSIAEEIEMRKERVEDLNNENLDWLFRELEKLSNVFRTDVNVYGTNGELIATSRPEIYDEGLVSTKINPEAYYELFYVNRLNYFQPEDIGDLSYLSAYQPIFNEEGDYLGFINLPYFTRQDKYRQEITTFIVAFLNLYVIFFLTSIIVAVFIANQITRPLTLIRDNLRKMELGKRSKPIDYQRDDEIGSLVKEYNKKVDELAASAELLARSERESAWREMAKQIAHEIKNPLTPMKLNVQYLQRLKGDPDEIENGIDRVSRLLIEQIDTLSSIATEFSNFAKIPTARNQVFNLSEQLRKTIDLFEANDKAIIRLKIITQEEILVKADKEQFSRAIINLVKNAIQAIPANQEGLIHITLSKKNHNALIEVEDNGIGIAEDLQDKLFSPSFTTKTSGMGLGLAIVKNIVENFMGRIWFKTRQGVGTTFFVEIPVFENEMENEDNNTE
ncbi:MAG: HAMP domain-containing histidine kinase [Prolixibacteraceae bacterium]|nr:HAMP domain-containing histidine kinase [Prolixibacteraceae bacterium]